MELLIINGPNLNMLGIREPDIYGKQTYADLVNYINDTCDGMSITCEVYQSNHEGQIVDKIQESYNKIDGIVINPAAYTHTSVAILDALKAVALPSVEVHLSDIDSREDFRKLSYPSKACLTTFAGYGFEGYQKAIFYLKEYIESANK